MAETNSIPVIDTNLRVPGGGLVIGRETAIARLRKVLTAMCAPGQSMCEVARERKIICGGLAEVNELQLRRQAEQNVSLACDAQWRLYETCRGWDDFSNEDLARFCFQFLGQDVEVVGRKGLAVI